MKLIIFILPPHSGESPRTHFVNRPPVYLFCLKQHLEDLGFPNRAQAVRVDLWQANERAVSVKTAISNNRMNVWVKVGQLAKRLDAGDHARKDPITTQDAAVHVDNGFPGGAGKIAQQRAVETEVDTEPFGDRQDNLSVRHSRADGVCNRVSRKQRALLMATGAETSLPAGEGNEHLMEAVVAANSGKPIVQVAAGEKSTDHFSDDWAPGAVAVLIALVVGSLKLGEVAFDEPVER